MNDEISLGSYIWVFVYIFETTNYLRMWVCDSKRARLWNPPSRLGEILPNTWDRETIFVPDSGLNSVCEIEPRDNQWQYTTHTCSMASSEMILKCSCTQPLWVLCSSNHPKCCKYIVWQLKKSYPRNIKMGYRKGHYSKKWLV